MSPPASRPPGSDRCGPFKIAWWEATRGDESDRRQVAFPTQVEAELVLALLSADPANDGLQCSWLEPVAFTETPLPF